MNLGASRIIRFGGTAAARAPNPPTITSVVGAGGSVTNGGTTSDTSFTVNTSIAGTGAVAGDLLRLFDGASQTGSDYTLLGGDIVAGTAANTTGSLSVAAHSVTAKLIHSALLNSSSNAWAFTITAAAVTWSTTNHGTVVLSNGNLTVSGNISGQTTAGRSDATISGTQKIYWEVSADILTSNNGALGVANSSWPFTDASFDIGDANSLGYYGNGQVFQNSIQIATLGSVSQGTVIGIAVDFAVGKIWFTLDGTTWNNDIIASQNPVGRIGGISYAFSGTVFPIYQCFNNASSVQYTADFGATTFTYSALFTTLQGAGYAHF